MIKTDLAYALKQLRGICQVTGCNDRASDRVQRAIDALERIEAVLAEDVVDCPDCLESASVCVCKAS